MRLLAGNFHELEQPRNNTEANTPSAQEENHPSEFVQLRQRITSSPDPLVLFARSNGEFAEIARNVIIEHSAQVLNWTKTDARYLRITSE